MSDQPSNFDGLDDQIGWYGRKSQRARRRYKLLTRGFLLDQCVRSTTSRNVQSPAQASFFLNMPCNTVCRIGRVSKKPMPDIT
jgi:hypothetical protein